MPYITRYKMHKEYRITYNLWKLHITYEKRDADAYMGRFGGGWAWKIGAQGGGHTLIVYMLIFSVHLVWA